ncbi:MAG: T9SS type A sorting domain-containing protein, partial [Saprospiraceae bacterium]
VTRTYRATDACGNSATCNQVITVNDQTPPTFTFVPSNTTVDCYLVPGVDIATANDNCTSGATVTFLGEVKTPGVCPVLFTLTRTWRATDACGNSATASQVVTVTDTQAPQFLVLPQNAVAECGPDNMTEFQAFLDNHGAAVAEDCAAFTFSYADSPVQNNTYNCGLTFRRNIRFIATDVCGNSTFREASFTVADLTPPVFSTPPQNVSLECDDTDDLGENAFYSWLDSDAGLVAEDACGTVTLEKILIAKSQGCGGTWQKTYEFRAKDQCGNLTKTTASFAVVDHRPPTLVCPPNDNIYLNCVEDVPAADPTALSAWDCSGVQLSLQDTWTKGTGCPDWPMTVAYRYAATDACGNVAVCERAFYVKETDTPTLICPDTIKLPCVDDIPGPLQVFSSIKSQLAGNCPKGFISITILADSGQPETGSKYRTYSFRAKNHCGYLSSACSVTFLATGNCNQLCTATPSDWGDPNATIGNLGMAEALEQLIQMYGPPTVGGGDHTVSAPTAACVQELLAGSGNVAFLPTGHHTCPLPDALANPDGTLNNHLAANALAMQLNIWYNLKFNNRNLAVQDIHNLPDCLVEYPLLKDLGQHTAVQDVLDLTNLYLQGIVGTYTENLGALLDAALDNLNSFRVDCEMNGPCERPANNRSDEMAALGSAGMHLIPNPATDAVTLRFETPAAEEMQVRLLDSRGLRYVRNVQATKGLNNVFIALENLPAGVYWVSLQGSATLETRRLVKVRE